MAPGTDTYAELEIGIHRAAAGAYQVELRFTDPENEAEMAPVRGPAPIDPAELLALQHQPRAYGEKLAERLFHDPEVGSFYRQVKATVARGELFLRLRLLVGPSASELHALRWELLADPDSKATSKAPLATSERTLFSRFILSRDWRHVRPRPRAELTALIAVAAPSDVGDRYGLAEVPRDGEIDRARRALGAIEPAVIERPVTLERLVDRLRDGNGGRGVDVLYLVCHGAWDRRRRKAALFLEDEDGKTARIAAADLAELVAGLERPPRLAVLASCESGTMAETAGEAAQSSLAPLLADAGVPAIVAMQGQISMATVEKAMPVFFARLLEDGQIDRAMAIARGAVRDHSDSWMPALYLRLKSGRLWSDAGFGGGDEVKWKNLCRHVRDGKSIPILGPGAAEKVCLTASETARRLAAAHGSPLAARRRGDLPRVLQYLSVKEKPLAVLPELIEQLHRQVLEIHGGLLPDELRRATLPELMDEAGKLRRRDPDEPHRVLAELPASIYVTANYDNLLYRALQARGRSPRRLACRWRDEPPVAPAIAGREEPSQQCPAVYHVFGRFGVKESLVLTEDDYFDYLIAAASNHLIPGLVERSLVDRSLLLLGFRLTDWSFRVLFRLIMSLPGRERLASYPHVAVQVDPEHTDLADAAGARRYLERYFGTAADIDVYWGSVEDFLEQLCRKLATLPVEIAIADEDGDSGWD